MALNTSESSFSRRETAFRAMIRAYGLARRVMDPYFARYGISGSQWGVLRVLHRADAEQEPELLLSELGKRLLVRPPSVTGTVDRLERLGLVVRTASPTDLRSKTVSLTPAGRQLIERVREGHQARLRMILSGLSDEEQGQLQQLLEKLSVHMKDLAEQEPGEA
jgi:DNA-binding MarR family transcriptional regulator